MAIEYKKNKPLIAEQEVFNAFAAFKADPWQQHLGEEGKFGLWVKASGATPRIKITLVGSFVEGTAGDVGANYVKLEGAAVTLTIVDTNPHLINLPAMNAPYQSILVEADVGNGADTKLTAHLLKPQR